MHATKMLQQFLQKNCPNIHAVRLSALMDNIAGLVHGQTLTVTGLGRALPRATSMKHSIKQSDRLIGNSQLTSEVPELLRQVKSGKSFTITNHGKAIADLVPSQQGAKVRDKVAAAEKLKVFMLAEPMRGVNIRELIEEGRA